MPLIRAEISAFVHTWNHHEIRKQPKRPNSVAGKPINLYEHPKEGVANFGRVPNQATLQLLEAMLPEFGKCLNTTDCP